MAGFGGGLPRFVRVASLLMAGAAVLAAFAVLAAMVAWRHLGGAEDAFVRAVTQAGQELTDVPQQVRFALSYNVAAALGAALAAGLLAVLVRRPRRWVKTTVWWVTAVAWLTLGFGLATGPDVAALPAGLVYPQALLSLQKNLVPTWYSSVNTLMIGGVLAAFTVVAVLLVRDSAEDFYQSGPETPEDPRWSAVFQKATGSTGPEDSRDATAPR